MKKMQDKKPRKYLYFIAGLSLILIGIMIFLDQHLKFNWIYILISIFVSGIFYFEGSQIRNKNIIISSTLILVFGIGLNILVSNLISGHKIGWFSLLLALGFVVVFSALYFNYQKIIFWTFIPIILLFFIGVAFLNRNYTFLSFTFFIGLGIGIALLGSGLYWKLFGLIIPGCLLIGISPGLFFAWGNSNVESGLVNTGVFLVCFALGWGLITIFSKVQTQNFLWWPLIPGGILAMVGWGLYIGGNPKNAVGFIGNTGSIGLIIFGIYILLMKRGIQR
jgi:hypothetical protein